ncbi:MAG TPA: cell envelope integrity protein CreD [Chitinophagaceae bacterium]|nr:cell envelope integrity protein CreD [Chitinophagaceae bacterium]
MESVLNSIWQKSKLLIKGLIIGVLVLLLLIPAYFVQNLIQEREARQKEAVWEVSSKWAGSQNISGPILVIPYEEKSLATNGQLVSIRRNAYFLPDKLDIKAKVYPEKRYRGIYEVMLYTSTVGITGKFPALPLQALKLQPADMLWNEAYLCMGISDTRGLKEEIRLKWNDSVSGLVPSMINNAVLKEGLSAPVIITETAAVEETHFSATINLNGSEQLLFTPVGRETTARLESAWPDPSFTGAQLPVSSDIKDSGFVANWKSVAYNRGFPQHWKNDAYNLGTAAFGTDLFIPVNGYQKTMRSVKYAILCILLTFTAFFLIETTNRKSVHPVQYALIGFALILFYTLLLSFSEYTGFNTAYGIASIATVGLITWFVKGLLGSMKLSLFLSFVLILLYSYVFTILQLQDYALLLGSIGLFLTLAVVMYFSRKIQW